MLFKLYEKIIIFLFPILLVFSIVMTLGFFLRGETIIELQSELVENKDKKVEAVLSQIKSSEIVGDKFEKEKIKIEVQKEYITNVVEKIIEKPIYINNCFDDAGLQLYNENIRSLNSPSKP